MIRDGFNFSSGAMLFLVRLRLSVCLKPRSMNWTTHTTKWRCENTLRRRRIGEGVIVHALSRHSQVNTSRALRMTIDFVFVIKLLKWLTRSIATHGKWFSKKLSFGKDFMKLKASFRIFSYLRVNCWLLLLDFALKFKTGLTLGLELPLSQPTM